MAHKPHDPLDPSSLIYYQIRNHQYNNNIKSPLHPALMHGNGTGKTGNSPFFGKIIAVERGKLSQEQKQQDTTFGHVRKDDLFICMKTFLLFGKCIGLVPISGIFCNNGDLEILAFRKYSLSGLTTLGVILILTCNTFLAFAGYFREGGRDATQLAKNAAGTVCYSMGLYVYFFIYGYSNRLVDLFRKWRNLDSDECLNEDASLKRSINLIAGIILTSAIAENAVSHLLLFPLSEMVPNPLEYYYVNSHKQWSEMIPYHATMAMAVFLCNKWAVYAWNFGDIFIAVLSRSLYGKFRSFTRTFEQKLMKDEEGININAENDKETWNRAIVHHEKMCKLTAEVADMLSPLVFTSFAVNIYFVCIQLHLFLAPSKRLDFISALYVSWSFFHLIGRTYTVALSAAKVNVYAQQFVQLLQQCPITSYTKEIERAERRLLTNPVGLHGFGTFLIGRPFVLSVISVIFTFEIVLLQTNQMMSNDKGAQQ